MQAELSLKQSSSRVEAAHVIFGKMMHALQRARAIVQQLLENKSHSGDVAFDRVGVKRQRRE